MFWITRDPSSGSSIQCLAKITVMVLSWSVDMDCIELPDEGSLVIRNMLEQF